MAAMFEVQSFLWKFQQLSSIGINANLNLNSSNGHVFVNFAAELGQGYFDTQNLPSLFANNLETTPPVHQHRKACKPSQLKRRKRRKEQCDLDVEKSKTFEDTVTEDTTLENMSSLDANDQPHESENPESEPSPTQMPINCIRQVNGCMNIVHSYYNRYTAICDSCFKFMEEKLKSSSFDPNLCPCCHEPSQGSFSLCAECLQEVYQDGW